MILVAILLPWLSFMLRGKILVGIICFFLQITLFGWLPAAIWAVVSYNKSENEKKLKHLEDLIRNTHKS